MITAISWRAEHDILNVTLNDWNDMSCDVCVSYFYFVFLRTVNILGVCRCYLASQSLVLCEFDDFKEVLIVV